MSNAILVLPELPGKCVDCALCRVARYGSTVGFICAANNEAIPMVVGTDRPDWCPLISMPAASDIQVRIKQIADFYGWRHQRDKTIEECGELIVALEKMGPELRPSRPEADMMAVITELADVEIMVRQIAYLMGAEVATQAEIGYKLDRQIERMKEASGRNG